MRIFLLSSVLLFLQCSATPPDPGTTPPLDPPFHGTIFLDGHVVTEADSSLFVSLSYAGQALRTMYDRRTAAFTEYNAYLFDAVFADGLTAEVQVNPEFGSPEAAQVQAERYAWYAGQLPTVLRQDMETMWIHMGVESFGGGNNNLLIHIGRAEEYLRDGILEETLIHEATHTSLDGRYREQAAWLQAQQEDNRFISTYARDNPNREDMAESFLPYMMVQLRADRIPQALADTIRATMPHRIAYFNSLGLDLSLWIDD